MALFPVMILNRTIRSSNIEISLSHHPSWNSKASMNLIFFLFRRLTAQHPALLFYFSDWLFLSLIQKRNLTERIIRFSLLVQKDRERPAIPTGKNISGCRFHFLSGEVINSD